MRFNEMGLRVELVEAVERLGFQAAMPIQAKVIPILLKDTTDLIGLAQTGTGKTGAFGLPLLQRIDAALSRPQGIVLCPTRELCLQITNDLLKFARHMKKIRIVPVYGGASIAVQIRQIKKGPQIIVATPGRLLDLIGRRAVDLSRITVTVLDEADEMLNMGFQEDIDRILAAMPARKNIWLFSATMPAGVARIARSYLSDPAKVSVGSRNQSPASINHRCYVIHEKNRLAGLKRIIDFTPDMFGLVFCRTRKDTQTLAEALLQDGYRVEALHGDLSQPQRDSVMRKFRQKSIRLMVATDVAARGLDVNDITHVIHYHLPHDALSYTHRSGRTARAGKSGTVIALVGTKEGRHMRELEKRGNFRFEVGQLPDGRAVCNKQLSDLVEKIVHTTVKQEEIADYLPAFREALDGFDREELIRRLVAAEFNRFPDSHSRSGNLNARIPVEGKTAAKISNRKNHFRKKNTQRFFINVGRLDKINAGAIVRLICDKSGIRSSRIGAIDLNREFSFFEVEKKVAGRVWSTVKDAKLDGRLIQVRKVEQKKKQRSPERLSA